MSILSQYRIIDINEENAFEHKSDDDLFNINSIMSSVQL